MKKLIFLLIPIVLMMIIVFGVVKMLILGDTGKGALQVTSNPNSKVYLNNTYLGTTPLCRCEGTNMIQSGEYTLRIVPPDSQLMEFQEKVSITKGVLTVVDRKFGKGATSEGSIITLEPINNKQSAEMLVISFPDKADVFLDANYQEKSPYQIKNVTNSDHILRLKKDGYKDKSLRIRTPLGFKLVAVLYLGLKGENISTTNPTASQTTPTPTLTPTPNKKAKVVILSTPNGFLRVRQEASLYAAEITRVSPGDTFDVVEETEGWYKIQLQDGTSGWISTQFAQKQ